MLLTVEREEKYALFLARTLKLGRSLPAILTASIIIPVALHKHEMRPIALTTAITFFEPVQTGKHGINIHSVSPDQNLSAMWPCLPGRDQSEFCCMLCVLCATKCAVLNMCTLLF